jgi:Raf kinase inhibitor-like YbhB/YbcL family protein
MGSKRCACVGLTLAAAVSLGLIWPSRLAAQTGQNPPAGGQKAEGERAVKLTITSTAFADGQPIPKKYTGEGEDISPPLSWTGVPPTAKELALICDDPDAPRPQPWVHWVICKLPADTKGLPEKVAKTGSLTEPVKALQGRNSWGNPGYGGPLPPPGHGVHHYHFKLYALDASLEAQPGLEKEQLLAKMKGHIVAEGELIGTYQR